MVGIPTTKWPWTEWWQDDLPCQFSREQAAPNADFLVDLLGHQWIANNGNLPARTHPLISAWFRKGAEEFLGLNALSDDLRLLQKVEGFQTIIQGLKQAAEFKSTMLVVQSASRFIRGGARVVQFFASSNASVPDYLLEIEGVEVPVEAKQLTESDQSRQFSKYSLELAEQIRAEVLTGGNNYPEVLVVLKNTEDLPLVGEVVAIVGEVVAIAGQTIGSGHLEVRRPKFNIFTAGEAPSGLEGYKCCHIVCPRAKKENLRFLQAVKKSNKQLKNYARLRMPGVLVLGLTEHQDPHHVAELITGKFNDRQYRSISEVVLLQSGYHLDVPRRSTLDGWQMISHGFAHVPQPTKLSLGSAGLHTDLFSLRPNTDEISAYRRQFVEIRVTQHGFDVGFYIRDRLTADLLK